MNLLGIRKESCHLISLIIVLLAFGFAGQFSLAQACTANSDCTDAGTLVCDSVNSICVACLANSDCTGATDCKDALCNADHTCALTDKADSTACTGGHCCAGTCASATGNSNFAASCRTGPSCAGSIWQYTASGNGAICQGECASCNNGLCADNNSLCDSGNCVNGQCGLPSSCTDDTDCAIPNSTKPFCYAGQCVECKANAGCDDNNSCTDNICNNNACVYRNNDTLSCSGGHCCSGVCSDGIGNSNFSSACRSGPSCHGSRWEYTAANDSKLCLGTCRVCNSGYCSRDMDSKCSGDQLCISGTCGTSNCTSDDDCSEYDDTPYCDTNTHRCAQCLLKAHCYDGDSCTDERCINDSCIYENVTDLTACSTSGKCCGGVCNEQISDSGYDAQCRASTASCSSTVFAYQPANEGKLCKGSCGVCKDGKCNGDDDSKCTGDKICSLGICIDNACEDDSDCNSGMCDSSSGKCVGCIVTSDCNDNNQCTNDSCISGACVYNAVGNGTNCQGGSCQAGRCIAQASLIGANAACKCSPGESCVNNKCVKAARASGGMSAFDKFLITVLVIAIALYIFLKIKARPTKKIRLEKKEEAAKSPEIYESKKKNEEIFGKDSKFQ